MAKMNEFIMVILFYICRIFPIKKNKVVIVSYLGKGYGDNGKYIVEELIKRDRKFDIVWLCRNVNEKFPDQVRVVPYLSLKSIYEQCTAKIWIDNRRKPGYVRKRKNQYYIQTWHGNSALKKVEKDAMNVLPDFYIKAAINDSKMTNLYMSSSSWETQCFKDAFWYEGEFMEVGYPRQDILLKKDTELMLRIKEKLGISKNEKILLYVPTFRTYTQKDDINVYYMDWKNVLLALEKRFGGKWNGLIRLHPNISSLSSKLNLPDNVLNVTDYPDLQELLLISDCIITDYSSTIVEAGIAEKIGFLYAIDFDKFQSERQAYFEIEDMPFPLAKSNIQLIENINNFSEEKYRDNMYEFFYEKYGLRASGNASKYIADRIEQVVNGGF